jgi:poly(3-hydroxybutyrate) depolymerase
MTAGPYLRIAGLVLGLLGGASRAVGQALPRGQVVDDVTCAGDPAESYALYLPSTYAPTRPWSVLIGFHPGARGRAIVEKYRAAAEQYGYIVAASNNSRNGAWAVSAKAIQAMSADLGQRFAVDGTRVYLTGLSGGARVAMQVALGKSRIAGVIASSAGYPDSQPRASVPFAIFGTAGTDDFNYIEMRMLDRYLTTPHHVAIFQGGHTLPPDDVAMEAIEWMELQAMASGKRPRDEALVDRLLARRQSAIAAAGDSPAAVHLLQALADDFKGLRDVSAASARAAELSKQKDIKRALARERDDDDAEARTLDQAVALEAGLADDARRAESLQGVRDLLSRLSKQAGAAADSPERGRARRLLRIITMSGAERTQDQEYLTLLARYRPAGSGRGRTRVSVSSTT